MKHLLILFFVALFTCKAAAQQPVKPSDSMSFHTICMPLLTNANFKAQPIYLLSVQGIEYVINAKAFRKKVVDVNWISGIQVLKTSNDITDGHFRQPPTIIFKLNTQAYPQAFDLLKPYLALR